MRGKPFSCAHQSNRPETTGVDASHLGNTIDMNEQELTKTLELLKTEHRDLDAAISALTEAASADQLQIARLKKRKLRLKDQISIIEDALLPDIIA